MWNRCASIAGIFALLIGAKSWASRSTGRGAGDDAGSAKRPSTASIRVTPVRGAGWLKHLGLRLDETHMGQMGGESAPPPHGGPVAPSESPLRRAIDRFFSAGGAEANLAEPFKVTGADLYRLNCRSCHGPEGKGAPPEIKPLLDPVRATSVELLKQHLEELDRPINDRLLQDLASQAQAALRKRIHEGGEKMPPFEHLQGEEVEALVGHLGVLAGVPGAKDREVTESTARVGEHLVKGTCHVCHDATGPGGGHMMMMHAVIPSLASFPEQKSVDEVARKVLQGSWGMMARMARMPVFPYLTEDEVAAAYAYLAAMPPQP